MPIPELAGFVPVTTFGGAFPLDDLLRPFLPRFARALMVSPHYAQVAPPVQPLPIFCDSGGFAAVFADARIVEREDGTAAIERTGEGSTNITPESALSLQRRIASYGCPLDFPIPPSITDPAERTKRIRLTLANARWALGQPHGKITLLGAVQGWDEASFADCASALVGMGYTHLALGGMVPRLSDPEAVEAIVRRVRATMAPGGHLHVFGVGKPELIARVLRAGADSTDSSSYVQTAASGRCWGATMADDPAPIERAQAALRNLQACVNACKTTSRP